MGIILHPDSPEYSRPLVGNSITHDKPQHYGCATVILGVGTHGVPTIIPDKIFLGLLVKGKPDTRPAEYIHI